MMNTNIITVEPVEEQVERDSGPLTEENLPGPFSPQEDDSSPVLPRPVKHHAEAFLPEWLRRFSHG